MSKKSTTKQTANQTVTATPTNPEWVTSGVQGLQTRINSLLDTDASKLVPGASGLQTKAFDQAGQVGGWRPGLQVAGEAAQGFMSAPMSAATSQGGSLLDMDLDAYQNPWTNDVVDTTLTGFDEQAGMRRAELAAAQARGQRFSGSGSAIERALFERGNIQDRAGTEAQLRAQGFDRATDLAGRDLDRRQQNNQFNVGQTNSMTLAERDAQMRATGLLGDLTNSGAANDRADIGLLSTMGGQQREIEREKLGADVELLKLISALQGNQPYDMFRGQTSVGNSSSTTKTKESDPMGALSGLLAGAGAGLSGLGSMGVKFSDKRLKTDIETVGKDRGGRRVVSYRYKGEPEGVRRVGHIAQEVRKTDPHAVRKIGKHLAIDYGLLGEVA